MFDLGDAPVTRHLNASFYPLNEVGHVLRLALEGRVKTLDISNSNVTRIPAWLATSLDVLVARGTPLQPDGLPLAVLVSATRIEVQGTGVWRSLDWSGEAISAASSFIHALKEKLPEVRVLELRGCRIGSDFQFSEVIYNLAMLERLDLRAPVR